MYYVQFTAQGVVLYYGIHGTSRAFPAADALRQRGCVAGPRSSDELHSLFCAVTTVTVGMARWATDGKDRIGVCGKKETACLPACPPLLAQHTHSVDSNPVCREYRRAAEGWHARAAAV